MEEALFNVLKLSVLRKNDVAENLKSFFKTDGSIYFEHGYGKPTFKVKETNYRCFGVDENGLRCMSAFKGKMHTITWDKLTKLQLLTLAAICNAYYRYCLHEA